MRTQALAKMRHFLWESLHQETDAGRRRVMHEALVSVNPMWIERIFRLVTSEIPPPVPEPFRQPESLFYRPDPSELQGEVFLGHTEDGHRVQLPLSCFGARGDVMVTGIKGAGKTSLLKFLAAQLAEHLGVLVFDTEHEYGQILPALDQKFLVLEFADYRRNLFVPPDGCRIDAWLELMKTYLREDFQIEDSAINLFGQVCAAVQRGGAPLMLPIVLTELRRSVYRSQSQKALINRITGLLNATGEVFAAGRGIDVTLLGTRSVVIVPEGTGLVARSLFYHDLYTWFAKSREFSTERGLQNIWIFDEAHTLFSRLVANRNPVAEPLAFQMFRMARKRGIGLLVGDQIPNMEHPIVRGNIGLKIIFRLADFGAVQLYSRALGLSPEQQHGLLNLPPRVALVHHPDIPKPFLVRLPDLQFRQLTAEQLTEHRRYSLQVLGLADEVLPRERGLTEPPSSQPVADTGMASEEPSTEHSPVSELATTPTATAEPLSNDTQAYLVDIARDPFLEATQRDRRLGHSGWKGNRVRAELVERGLVRLVRVNTYRRGGAFTACEVTQQGRGLLQEIKVPYRVRGKGGFVHRYWQHIIQAWLRGQGHHAEIEVRSPGGEKQVDVGATVDGSRVAFEVVVVGLDKEQSNLTKDREDGWDRVVFCCDRTSTIRSLQRRFGGAHGLEFRLLSSFS